MNEIDSFWEYILKKHKLKRYSPGTTFELQKTYYQFFELTESTQIADLERLSKVEQFILKLREREFRGKKLKDSTIRSRITKLSSLMSFILTLQEFEQTDHYSFSKNAFLYVLKTYNFNKDTISHAPRTQLELDAFFYFVTNKKHKLLFVLNLIGLRRFEVVLLEKEQISIAERTIKNVIRKGNRVQKKLGIPEFVIPLLEEYLLSIETGKLFNIHKQTMNGLFLQHHKRLIRTYYKLKLADRNEFYENLYRGLELIITNGPFNAHQLRATFDTMAEKNKMRENYRRFQLNHSLPGMDDIYIQIYNLKDVFQDYLQELNNCCPKVKL